MDIRNYITFNTIVDAGGFSKAATRLNYAQSTVTLHIKELETHYNELLFDRIGKRIYLTSFGETLHEKSKSLVTDYEMILDMNRKDKPVEILRIGIYESLLKYRMYDIIRDFKSQNPHVDILIHHGVCCDLRNMVRNGELDLTFQIEHNKEFSGLKIESLCCEKLSLIFPKNTGLELLDNIHQTIYLTEKDCSYRKLFDDFLNKNNVTRHHTMETSSVDMIKQYVSFGLGYSLVPNITVREHINNPGVEVIDFYSDKVMFTQLAYHKDKYLFPAMKSFINLVKKYARDWD